MTARSYRDYSEAELLDDREYFESCVQSRTDEAEWYREHNPRGGYLRLMEIVENLYHAIDEVDAELQRRRDQTEDNGSTEPANSHAGSRGATESTIAAAYSSLAWGDPGATAQAIRQALAQSPEDHDVLRALAMVDFERRTQGTNYQTARRVAEQQPHDAQAQLAAADAAFAVGKFDEALSIALETVKNFSDNDRYRACKRLVNYFEILGPQDQRVVEARSKLSAMIF